MRWLLSCVPTAMIFDDHDVRDDWNTSAVWRGADGARSRGGASGSGRRWRRTGSTSTWATSPPRSSPPTPTTTEVLGAEGDTWPLLVELADRADAETDGSKGVRFSFRWDLGHSRFVMIDSRNGRILDDGAHLMLGDARVRLDRGAGARPARASTTSCSAPRCRGCCRTRSATCRASTRSPRPGPAGAAGSARRSARARDLEHWQAFRDVVRPAHPDDRAGRDGDPDAPATVSVLSGDVHHSYAAQVDLPDPGTDRRVPASTS